VSEDKLQKRPSGSIKERGQYLLAFGVVGSMLIVAGMPIFVIFFFAIFAYFIFRIFASGSRNETRDIFEFYLTANEILRDDGRNWFGFEVKDAIARGEGIVNRMKGSPPLVHFALGALYNKAGDHQAAINALTPIVESDSGNEAAFVYPTQELRNYVRVLRKIERDPSEAPLTSASVRALERARRLRAKAMLEESRAAYVESMKRDVRPGELSEDRAAAANAVEVNVEPVRPASIVDNVQEGPVTRHDPRSEEPAGRARAANERKDPFANRKPISEVLHDIYDKNVQ
jgi:hypothetical protein